ncbi:hypothetical protein [Halorubellus litoreus]|uniref:Uncharacterized protein n=1 Tax=Halorubellus litoreus TaxID=755308 RepID=A0ABD5VM97_9EURY
MSDVDGISKRDIIAAAILEELLIPYQEDEHADSQFSKPLYEIRSAISDYPDEDVNDVADELAGDRSGLTYDNGDLVLENRNRAKNYYSMCAPF